MSLLPTIDDLQDIPLRALVGYAARCAQRVQPLFLAESKHPEAAASIRLVQKAIQVAMKFSAGEKIALAAVSKLEDEVTRAIEVATEEPEQNKDSILAGNAAYATINATHLAILSLDSEEPANEAGDAVQAVGVAVESAAAADESAAQAAGLDWVLLSRMDLGHFPLLGEPLDAGEEGPFGPLNPNFLMDRQRLKAEQARIDKAKSQLEPELAAMREECEKLHLELERIRSEEAKIRANNASFEDDVAILEQEQDHLRALAQELKGLLSHWALAET
ncbi:MAG: hypothetical protein IID46_06855 [Planctomycetes bacterium]|nr:hypothetical protein [Planctomycetota bacterium]